MSIRHVRSTLCPSICYVYNWIHAYSAVPRRGAHSLFLDTRSFTGLFKSRALEALRSEMNTSDPTGVLGHASRGLAKKKITDIDGKCYSFAGSDMRATAKQTCAVVVKSILLPHRHRSAIGTLQLVRLGNETPIRTPCNASRTLICKKHVQRRLHYTYCMYGKYILIIAL